MRLATFLLSVFAFLAAVLTGCRRSGYISQQDTRPVSHALWDSLLKSHVDANGWVSYESFVADSAKLNRYLDLLADNVPNETHWSEEEQLAYWINAYNAFTVQLVARHYEQIKSGSIRDIYKGLEIPTLSTVWHLKFITLNGEKTSLDYIEHGVLRKKFSEPRIHFAINCASVSCPPLRNEAFVAERLDAQLSEQARAFLADETRNRLSPGKLNLSKIFSWFKGDFTKESTLIDYLSQYTDVQIDPKAKISHLEYDWRLNVKGNAAQ